MFSGLIAMHDADPARQQAVGYLDRDVNGLRSRFFSIRSRSGLPSTSDMTMNGLPVLIDLTDRDDVE
jgi:hypothetical protein